MGRGQVGYRKSRSRLFRVAGRRQWEKARRIARRFDALLALGDSASCSADWIDVILAAGRAIEFRPVDAEAVAPYQVPHTPPTTNLAAVEARQVLQRDWLYQAGGTPEPAWYN